MPIRRCPGASSGSPPTVATERSPAGQPGTGSLNRWLPGRSSGRIDRTRYPGRDRSSDESFERTGLTSLPFQGIVQVPAEPPVPGPDPGRARWP